MNTPSSSSLPVQYCPPSYDVLEHFAYTACHELGPDFTDPEVVRGFTNFMQTAARICANNLNRKANPDLGTWVE